MSESAINGPFFESSSEPSSDAQLLSIDHLANENSVISQHEDLQKADIELRPLLDTEMSQAEITQIVQTWNPNSLFRGKEYSDRPSAAIQWMLEQTKITVNVGAERTQLDILADRERRKSRGLPMIKAHKNVADLTPEQLQRLELASVNDRKIAAAQRKVDALASEGLSSLIELIEDLESVVMRKCPNANIVRLFNAVDDKTGGRDRDLIIAKRTLVMMLADDLPGETSQ